MADQVRAGLIPVKLGNGTEILVESSVTVPDGTDSADLPSLKRVGDAIEGVAQDLMGAIKKAEPDTATVALGFEVSGEAGLPVLAKGKATANVTVTLEWAQDKPKP
jgi:hypothetical protein